MDRNWGVVVVQCSVVAAVVVRGGRNWNVVGVGRVGFFVVVVVPE